MIHEKEPKNFYSRFDVVSVLVEYDGKILLLHRQDHKPEGGTWCLPAGKVDSGEDLAHAMSRELLEETGIMIDPRDLKYHRMWFVTFPTYEFRYHIFSTSVKNLPNVSINNNEHKAFCWKSPVEALHMNLIQDEDTCLKLHYNI